MRFNDGHIDREFLLDLFSVLDDSSNALFRKIFSRELPEGTIITEDSMIFELPAGSDEIRVVSP